jgi:pimeloyl-ACP methyl ester carboxylesterase
MIKKHSGKFTSSDGTSIYFESRGTGPAMIFAYGIGCLINHWRHQIKHFAQTHQVIVFDYRGHHKSEIPKDIDSMTISRFAKDVVELCDHLEIKEAAFVAHSFGVQVLLSSYQIRPELFKSLIFVNGFVKNPMAGMFGNNYAADLFVIIKRAYTLLPLTATSLFRKAVTNSLSMQISGLLGGFNLKLASFKDVEIYARGVASMDLSVFIRLFEDMMSYDGEHILDTITAPTLVIGGKNDAVTPERFQIEIHDKIAKSEFLMVPMGSHCTQLDMPDLVNLRIEKFLQDNNWAEKTKSVRAKISRQTDPSLTLRPK